jgi:hypothetical protein
MTPKPLRALLALLLLAAPALAAEPRAGITGPTTGFVNQQILLDLSSSVYDRETPLQVKAAGLDVPSIRVYFDEAGKAALAVVTPPRPGLYHVIVFAIGKKDGAAVPSFDFTAWPIEVSLPGPAPKPPDPPGPGPEPPPPVPPGPTPVAGNLWGVLVLPDLPSASEAALRTSPALRAAFASAPANYRSYLASEPELQVAGWKAALAAAGPPPVVLWIGDGGKIHRVTKAATEATVMADLKSLRGK